MTGNHRKSYKELKQLETFEERFDYLKETGRKIGDDSFGFDRYLNQAFYKSKRWKDARRKVIIRDNGNDLGIEGIPLSKYNITVHHLNPITQEDILNDRDILYDPDNLICTATDTTHKAIHFGDKSLVNSKIEPLVERYPNDQAPWKLKK